MSKINGLSNISFPISLKLEYEEAIQNEDFEKIYANDNLFIAGFILYLFGDGNNFTETEKNLTLNVNSIFISTVIIEFLSFLYYHVNDIYFNSSRDEFELIEKIKKPKGTVIFEIDDDTTTGRQRRLWKKHMEKNFIPYLDEIHIPLISETTSEDDTTINRIIKFKLPLRVHLILDNLNQRIDFTFHLEDGDIMASSKVLYLNGGEYFKRFFTGEFKKEKGIKLLDFDVNTVETYLDFISSGKIKEGDVDYGQLYELAQYFDCEPLLNYIRNFLFYNSTSENVDDLAVLYDKYQDPYIFKLLHLWRR
jgi:hypothetical protein